MKNFIKKLGLIAIGLALAFTTTVHADRTFTLPNQTGNGGKFLQTNGTNPLWATSGGTIAGSIANKQIAVGSGANTISGSGALQYNPSTGDFNFGQGASGIRLQYDSSTHTYGFGDITHQLHGTYFQILDGSQQQMKFWGDQTFDGNTTPNPLFAIDFPTATFQMGDWVGNGNNTSLQIRDNQSTVNFTGMKSVVQSPIHPTFVGSIGDMNTMVINTPYSGNNNPSYQVQIDGIANTDFKINLTTGVLPTLGDLITNTTTGATGTFVAMNGVNYQVSGVSGGTFNNNDIITWTAGSGKVGTVPPALYATFAWTGQFGSGETHKKITGATQLLNSGVHITLSGTYTGPGQLSDKWNWSYTTTFGTMEHLDGQNRTTCVGDCDNIANGTSLLTSDANVNQFAYLTANKHIKLISNVTEITGGHRDSGIIYPTYGGSTTNIVAGSGVYDLEFQTGETTAVSTVNLPTSATSTIGDTYIVCDADAKALTDNIKIQASAGDSLIDTSVGTNMTLNLNGQCVTIKYISSKVWKVQSKAN